jgi:translation initiation factor IF-3
VSSKDTQYNAQQILALANGTLADWKKFYYNANKNCGAELPENQTVDILEIPLNYNIDTDKYFRKSTHNTFAYRIKQEN